MPNKSFCITMLTYALIMLFLGPLLGVLHQESSKKIAYVRIADTSINQLKISSILEVQTVLDAFDNTPELKNLLQNKSLKDQIYQIEFNKEIRTQFLNHQRNLSPEVQSSNAAFTPNDLADFKAAKQYLCHILQIPNTNEFSDLELTVIAENLARVHGHSILIGCVLPLLMCFILWLTYQMGGSLISNRSLKVISTNYIFFSSITLLLLLLKGYAFNLGARNGITNWTQLNYYFISNKALRSAIYGIAHTFTFFALFYFVFKVFQSLGSRPDISEEHVQKKKIRLLRINAFLWTGVGVMLIWRGVKLFPETGNTTFYIALIISFIIGGAKGLFVLRKTAKRNILRIQKLEKPIQYTAILPIALYFLIPLMIGFGIALRMNKESIPGTGYTVGAIYVGIGTALFFSSYFYWKVSFHRKIRPAVNGNQKGILLINIGSPAEPTTDGLHQYLKEFLSDPFVIQASRWLWYPILYGIILPFRAPKSALLYQKIWKSSGSPLIQITQDLTQQIQQSLPKELVVDFAMRYGQPSIPKMILEKTLNGWSEFVVFPQFPQYSHTTTGSIRAAIQKALRQFQHPPKITLMTDFSSQPDYIDCLVKRVQQSGGIAEDEILVCSFHGLPLRYTLNDPYVENCKKTFTALTQALELKDSRCRMTFQSRFGREEWVKPYTDQTIIELAKNSQKVAVICPSFLVDCLETLEEIDTEIRTYFMQNGGKDFRYIPCLNTDAKWASVLTKWAQNLPPDVLCEML